MRKCVVSIAGAIFLTSGIFAAPAATLTVGSASVKSGGRVSIPVSIAKLPGEGGLHHVAFSVSFSPPEAIESVKIRSSNAFEKTFEAHPRTHSSVGYIAVLHAEKSGLAGQVALATLDVQLKRSFPSEVVAISLNPDLCYVTTGPAELPLTLELVDGKIDVVASSSRLPMRINSSSRAFAPGGGLGAPPKKADASLRAAPLATCGGDATGDGSVGVTDILFLINFLFANGPAPAGAGDANGDGSVTVGDIFFLINHLFASGPAPNCAFPTISFTSPVAASFTNADRPLLVITYSDATGINTSSLAVREGAALLPVTCEASGNGSTCLPDVPLADASHTLTASISNASGNASSATIQFTVDTTPPILALTAPAPSALTNEKRPAITLTFSDANGVNESSLAFTSNSNSLAVSCTSASASAACTPTDPLPEGDVSIAATIADLAGNEAYASTAFTVDSIAPSVTITSPAAAGVVYQARPLISMSFTDSGSVEPSSVVLLDNGSPLAADCQVSASGGTCTPAADLPNGANAVVVRVSDSAGNQGSSSTDFTVDMPPIVNITEPENFSFVNISPITVRGTVSGPAAAVSVNGVSAPVSNGSYSVVVPLVEGNNTLTAVATVAGGSAAGTASVAVTLDTTPPRVTIQSPAEGYITNDATVNVSGIVNDIVVGTVNEQQAQVTINGVAAAVANRSFVATSIPLTVGENFIQAVGRDRVGNAFTTGITVRRENGVGARIAVVSGNGQSAVIATELPAPPVVRLTDASGTPVANRPVVFRVVQNNGALSDGASTPSASLVAMTGVDGTARARWIVGTRSGAGSNRVEATSTGFSGTAVFLASATPAQADALFLDAGAGQSGATEQPLTFPFVVIVTDAGHNRRENIPVTFQVRSGGGNLDGQPSITTNTDSDGRAQALLTLGAEPGFDNNVVEASISVGDRPVAFSASARQPGAAADTTISGVVLDNSNAPIAGVAMRLYQAYLASSSNVPVPIGEPVATDAEGRFVIAGAPVGSFKLIADGTTVQAPPLQYPSVEYDITTVAGQDVNVGSPIYLPALDTVSRLCVSATVGGTLTLPASPGFSLTVAPDSATFPGGSRSGCITVTPVHGDKVPMVPGFGQQPRFVVTIQPVGTNFNPPAQITLPNVDGLRPREVTEMYSYDHDLSAFIAIGTGTVSADGSVIRSDPGVGVMKAGWHCGGNPNAAGTAATCPECKKCEGNNCANDADCKPCSNSRICISGVCTSASVTVRVATPSNDVKTPTADKSFVSTNQITFTGAKTPACATGDIEWRADSTGANGSLNPSTASGMTYVARPAPPAAPNGRTASLTYTVTATLGTNIINESIAQDGIDKVRQQYIDMSKSSVPGRAPFIDAGESSGGHFTFAEIKSHDGEPWAIFSIFANCETWRTNYGSALTVNRGYTTPRHNGTIPGAATNSQHIYGTALDVASNADDWQDKRDAAKAAGACCEPLKISGYGHVHGDWRGGCPAGW